MTTTKEHTMNTPAVPPAARLLRTLVQLLVAFPAIVPALVQALHLVGVDSINAAGLLAIAATALAIVVGVQNLLEQAGLIPTLGGDPTSARRSPSWNTSVTMHASGPHIREAQAEILAAAVHDAVMGAGDLCRQLAAAKAAGTLVVEPFDMEAHIAEVLATSSKVASTSQQEANTSQPSRKQEADL